MTVKLTDHDAERAVIGSVLVDNAAFDEAADIVEAADFSAPSHRHMWAAIAAMRGRGDGVDLVTLRQELSDRGVIERIDRSSSRVEELYDTMPTIAMVTQYARRVADMAARRRMLDALQESQVKAVDLSQPADEAIDACEALVFAASSRRIETSGLVPASEGVVSCLRHIQHVSEHGGELGAPMGLVDVDKLLGGLHGGQLVVLAGRPGMGKSALALGCAIRMAEPNEGHVPFFSLEMPKAEYWQRMMAHEARVSLTSIRHAKLTRDDHAKLNKVAPMLHALPLHVDDTPNITLPKLRSRCRRLKAREGKLTAVFVDYLQLMRSGMRLDSREQEVAEISRGLKAIAKELDTPVIALAQLNRSCESRTDKRPQISDLRESGAIEQDADIIGFVYRDEVYNPQTEDRGIAEVIIGKNRSGSTGTARVLWQAPYTRFDSLANDDGAYSFVDEPDDYNAGRQWR